MFDFKYESLRETLKLTRFLALSSENGKNYVFKGNYFVMPKSAVRSLLCFSFQALGDNFPIVFQPPFPRIFKDKMAELRSGEFKTRFRMDRGLVESKVPPAADAKVEGKGNVLNQK